MRKAKHKLWPPDPKSTIRWGMIVMFVVVTATIMPRSYFLELDYEIGKRWTGNDLYADFDFPKYKPLKVLEAEENDALLKVSPVFLLDTVKQESTRRAVLKDLSELATQLGNYEALLEEDEAKAEESRLQYFLSRFKIDPNVVVQESPNLEDWNTKIEGRATQFLDKVYASGYIDKPKQELKSEVISLRDGAHTERLVDIQTLLNREELEKELKSVTSGLKNYENNLLDAVLLNVIEPNYYYSDTLTKLEEGRARRKISPVFGMVTAGEQIIQKGETVTKEADIILKSYLRVRQEKFGESRIFSSFLGRMIILSIIVFIFILFLRNNRPFIFYRNRRLGMILALFLLITIGFALLLKLNPVLQRAFEIEMIYVVPMCSLAIMLTAFFDLRVGFVGNILIGLFAGFVLPNGFEYFFVQFCAGTVACYSITRLRNRNDFFVMLTYVMIAYSVAYIGFNFYSKGSFLEISYANLVLLGLNVLLTVITYPLIYVFERVFGLTSDLTFVELLDTNHPLLRDMALQAPGTFQHSLQVANIAEAVVNHIGGNSLLTKVGALFHDIGKMKNPTFFIENVKRKDSPHRNITSEQSAQIIVAHVLDGIEMARSHNLPSEVVAFIRTHHGTSRVEFFFRKWKQNNPGIEIDEEKFRYPGPVPFSRETAVLMIADSCEAACRSMKDPNPENIREMVESIVDQKIAQRQFANANINFKDLAAIKEVVMKQLTSIYHGRIEYPPEAV